MFKLAPRYFTLPKISYLENSDNLLYFLKHSKLVEFTNRLTIKSNFEKSRFFQRF